MTTTHSKVTTDYEKQPKCPRCGLPMSHQDYDADGPCDQWVCDGEETGLAGCWNYCSPKEVNAEPDPPVMTEDDLIAEIVDEVDSRDRVETKALAQERPSFDGRG